MPHPSPPLAQMNDDGTPSNRLDSLAMSIAQELGSNASTVEEAKEDPLIIRYIEEGLVKANEESISRAAKVQVIIVMTLSIQLIFTYTLCKTIAVEFDSRA